MRNRRNGNSTYVGNVCINRFIQIDTGNLFEGLKRIAKDVSANANNDLIEHAFRMGYLFGEKEYRFLKQTALKRNLSPAQLAWKQKINRRILSKTIVQRRSASEISRISTKLSFPCSRGSRSEKRRVGKEW